MKIIYIVAYGLLSSDPQMYSGFHPVIWGRCCLGYTRSQKCISLDAHLDLMKVMRCSTNWPFYSWVLSYLAFEWKWGYSWPCDLQRPYFSPEVIKLAKRLWKGTLHDTSSGQHAHMHEVVAILDQHHWLCCFFCSVLRLFFPRALINFFSQ